MLSPLRERVEEKVFSKDEKYVEFRIDYSGFEIKLDPNT